MMVLLWLNLTFGLEGVCPGKQMGGTFSKLFGMVWGRREYRILIVGLDGAGKTTILYRLQTGDNTTTVPTIGFNVETVTIKNIKFQVWDLGGQTSIRPYWRCYYANTDAIVYVIDSADKDRLNTAKAELASMLQEEELKNTTLLILANKQDLPDALTPTSISETLSLTDIKNRSWSIQKTSAITGEGLDLGFDWLANAIKEL